MMKTSKLQINVQNAVMNGEKPTVISLFAGCGGSSLGYQWAGFHELLAIDFDHQAVQAFQVNFPNVPIWEKDIYKISGREIMEFCNIQSKDLDVLDASPPCQGFSIAGKRQVNDLRNDLFLEVIRLIEELQPKVFVMENVTGLIKGIMKGRFKEIMQQLKKTDYQVKCEALNTKWFGVPQSRNRLIWIGVRPDLKILPSLPKPQSLPITLRESIGDLNNEMIPEQDHIWVDEEKRCTQGWLLAKGVKQGQQYTQYVKKLHWEQPCPTLLVSALVSRPYLKAKHCHPQYTRTLSLLECKRVQTFPNDFKFPDVWWGFFGISNSVPPKFMQVIAEHIRDNILIKT